VTPTMSRDGYIVYSITYDAAGADSVTQDQTLARGCVAVA
jgi:hypothetical protein